MSNVSRRSSLGKKDPATVSVARTIEYYNSNAAQYCEATRNIDLGDIYTRFLQRIPPGAHILDAGCGSGRDTKAFNDLGFKVTAIDASYEIARLASEYTGQPCVVMQFQEIRFDEQFDAIWACASLLHIPRTDIVEVLSRFASALRRGGVLYISLKEGEGEEIAADGRFFSNYTRSSFEEVLRQVPALQVVEFWKEEKSGETKPWIGFLVEKSR